jgi:hypothetical protein
MSADTTEIAKRLDSLEQKVAGHDQDLKQMFTALRALTPSERARRGIGFGSKSGK